MKSRPPEITIWAQGNPFLAPFHQYLPLFFKKISPAAKKSHGAEKFGPPAPWGLDTPGDWAEGGGYVIK